MTTRNLLEDLPRRFRISGLRWKIEYVNKEHPEIQDCFGRTHFVNQVVYIRDEQGLDQLVNTIVHELMHVVHNVFGLCDDENKTGFKNGVTEEVVTETGANGWCHLMIDNPKLASWLMAAFKEIRKEDHHSDIPFGVT